MPIKNVFLHIKKIAIHRFWVRHYCFKIGLYKQGIIHDLSKYSPVELFESARFYQGDSSPIDACKEKNGVSVAWFHHRGRNRHHWEYWVDDFQKGMRPVCMPYKYAAEMLCDFLGAGRAYMGDSFSIAKECEWWKGKRDVIVVHPAIKEFIDWCFQSLRGCGEKWLSKKHVEEIYITATQVKLADCEFDPKFLYK